MVYFPYKGFSYAMASSFASRPLIDTSIFLRNDELPVWGPIIFAAYAATAVLGLQFNSVNTFAAPIWAPAGIAVAAVLLRGYRISSWIFAAAFLVNFYIGASFVASLLIAFGNTLEALIAVYLIKRFADPDSLFRRFRDTLVFIAVAYASTAVSASIGVTALWFTGTVPEGQFWITWLAWRSGDALGVFAVVPLIVTWSASYTYPLGPALRHVGEICALIFVLLAANALSFLRPAGIPAEVPLLYLVSLPLAWAALRLGPRGVAVAILINLLIAIGATSSGRGPFIDDSFEKGLLFLQIYIAATAATFLIFAAIVKELTATRDALEQHVDELEYAVRKISSEDRAKADFLAELAHELRNPLAPVVSALELIGAKHPVDLDSETRDALDVIRKQTSTMSHLLNDLLDISRVSRRKVTLSKQSVDLRDAVKSALATTQSFIETRKHTIQASLGAKPQWVDADPVRLEQIVVNLLNNAAKYTNPGGSIRITTRFKNGHTELSVKDTGMGIEKGMLSRIFEPFQQLAIGQTTSSGLGIGLSLTKHLVELHQGTIEAHSEGPGKGTEFIVRIPSVSAPSKAKMEVSMQTNLGLVANIPSKSEGLSGNGRIKRRILIVDDNERAAQILSRLVETRGHMVRVAYDGPSALEIAPAFKPHIVILDIGLPHMDGYEVAKRMRELKFKKSLKLIALTGYGLEEDKKKALAAGFNHHLVKPVSIAILEPLLA